MGVLFLSLNKEVIRNCLTLKCKPVKIYLTEIAWQNFAFEENIKLKNYEGITEIYYKIPTL